jgi:hypothetical protein
MGAGGPTCAHRLFRRAQHLGHRTAGRPLRAVRGLALTDQPDRPLQRLSRILPRPPFSAHRSIPQEREPAHHPGRFMRCVVVVSLYDLFRQEEGRVGPARRARTGQPCHPLATASSCRTGSTTLSPLWTTRLRPTCCQLEIEHDHPAAPPRRSGDRRRDRRGLVEIISSPAKVGYRAATTRNRLPVAAHSP